MCYDLALLKINSEKKFLKLDWYGDFEPGLEVFTLGYPAVGQGEMTVSNGVVSSLRYFGDTSWTAPGFDTFGHTAPIFFGNSGSPVLNAHGELVGTAFDGNWEAMSGDIVYEQGLQRCISVDIRYILFIIDKYAEAGYLIDEMTIAESRK